MSIQQTPAIIDSVMRALADPTRRAVFERIARSSEITVGDLTQGSGVTQGAISQHLKSLRQAGLVTERPEGRNVYYRAQPQGLMPLTEWIRTYERFWTDGLDRLESLLLADDAQASRKAESASETNKNKTANKTRNKPRNKIPKKKGDGR